jgi:hypothetical protein
MPWWFGSKVSQSNWRPGRLASGSKAGSTGDSPARPCQARGCIALLVAQTSKQTDNNHSTQATSQPSYLSTYSLSLTASLTPYFQVILTSCVIHPSLHHDRPLRPPPADRFRSSARVGGRHRLILGHQTTSPARIVRGAATTARALRSLKILVQHRRPQESLPGPAHKTAHDRARQQQRARARWQERG